MKKVICVCLSILMLMSMSAGLNFSVFAVDIQGNNSWESDPIEFEDGKSESAIKNIAFHPNEEEFCLYDGNPTWEEVFQIAGNELEVEFTDGEKVNFICYPDGLYYCREGDKETELRRYIEEKGIEGDCNIYIANTKDVWEKGEEDNYFEITLCGYETRFFVDDYLEASPYKSISFSGAPIEAFYGTARTEYDNNNQGEWTEYQRYDVNKWNLERDGNALTVTYPDDSTKTYTCSFYEEDNFFGFRSEDGEYISTEDFILDSNQSPDNQWQNNGEYSVDVYFKGKHFTHIARVVENPVESVDVSAEDDITVFENCNGHFEWDDENECEFFRYDDMYDYLRAVNAVITVSYKNGDSGIYDFSSKDWIPRNRDTNERINERFFEFRFDQDENHLSRGINQNGAYVSYYGNRVYMDVDVVEPGVVQEGEINTDEVRGIHFLSRDPHIFTFTPDKTGVYEFGDSLADRAREGDEFIIEVENENGDIQNRLETDNDDIFYYLTAGVEYTITTNINRDGASFEYFIIWERTSLKTFKYTPANNQINVFEGDLGRGREIFTEGSKLEVTFTDGYSATFTCNDRGEFTTEDDRNYWDVFGERDFYCDCEMKITPSAEPWVKNQTSYYNLTIGNISKKVYVSVKSSEVESIVYNSKKTPEVIKDVDFWYDEWDGKTYLENDPFFMGDTVDITYNDERGTVRYKYNRDNEFYIDTDDGRENIYLNYTFDDSVDYQIGDTVSFSVAYQSGREEINATVTESDVESIEFTAAAPYRVYKEHMGWWENRDYWDEKREENVHEDFFHYDIPNVFRNGNLLSVNYKDGTSAEFEYNGRWFMDEDGNKIDDRYIRTEDEQWETHWESDSYNEFYVRYKDKLAPVPITVIDTGDWSLWAKAFDSNGNEYENGDTIYIEKGQNLFIYFETDFRNRENGVADIVGFSDGYDEGTLTERGFDVQTGNDRDFGLSFSNNEWDVYGFVLSSNNLRIGTKGVLNYWLYEDVEDYENFDFVNTPHKADYSLNVEVVDHTFEVGEVVEPTCTSMGYTLYTCETCGFTFKGDFTDFAEHSYIETVIPAAPNSRGYTKYTCENCGFEHTGNFTDYASDSSALAAAIEETRFYSRSNFALEEINALIDEAESYSALAQTNAPQSEYDYAVGEILTAIEELDELGLYEVTDIRGDDVILTNSATGDEASVSFEENINGYRRPLDVVKDGIVNAKDFAYIIRNSR